MSISKSVERKDDCFEVRCENGVGNLKTGRSDERLLLHDAARKYDCPQVKALLDRGWDPDTKDVGGRTVLHVLLSDGFLGHLYEANMEDCVKIILGKCDVNARDLNEETPLSLAVANGFQSCAILLVQYGADSSARTNIFKRMHSLPTKIAQTMPLVMKEILDSGVTLDYVINGDAGGGEPEVRVKLDWSPIFQYCQERDKENKQKLRKHKYGQRETSFLYSLLDVPPVTRNSYLTHPLVSAFLHLKSRAFSRKLRWLQMVLAFYPVVYMVFIYFLYFTYCQFKDTNDGSNETNSPSTTTLDLTLQLTTENINDDTSTTRNSRSRQEQLCEVSWSITLCAYLLMTIVAGFVLMEIYMQLRVDTRYLKSWRTWVLRVSLLSMGVTLWPALQFNTVYNITWQYPIAAMGTFFAWVMFLIQLELVPQIKIYLEMLVAITISVLKITLLFVPLLTGFYMGFNLMFFRIGGIMNFVLMTVDVGSNEYEEMVESAKDNRAWFTIIAYAFSITFIVVIAIVFMNFLLGVSISDIQKLKRNAKIMALSNRIQQLFVIDLVFPTWYNLVKEGNDKSFELRAQLSERESLLNPCFLGRCGEPFYALQNEKQEEKNFYSIANWYKRKNEQSYFSYGPYDATYQLPVDIRTQITLLLKSKRINETRSKPLEVNQECSFSKEWEHTSVDED